MITLVIVMTFVITFGSNLKYRCGNIRNLDAKRIDRFGYCSSVLSHDRLVTDVVIQLVTWETTCVLTSNQNPTSESAESPQKKWKKPDVLKPVFSDSPPMVVLLQR